MTTNTENYVTPLQPEKPKIIVSTKPQVEPIVADISHNLIILSKDFNQFIQEMPEIISQAKTVLGLEDDIRLDLDSLEDSEIEAVIKTLEKPTSLWRQFSDNRTQVNRQLTNFTSVFKTSLEDVAQAAGFGELETLRNESLRVKKELSSNRIQKGWNNAFDLYTNALSAYPQVEQMFPQLTKQDSFERLVTNFGLFKVTGSKSFKLTSTIKTAIANLATRLGDLATQTAKELSTLPTDVHGTIIRTLISQPDTETLYKQVQLQRTVIAAQAQAEQARLAQANAQQAAQANAPQGQQQSQQPAPQQAIQAEQPMAHSQAGTIQIPFEIPLADNGQFFMTAKEWLVQSYIPQLGNQFYDVLTNPGTKLNLILNLSAQIQDPNSQVAGILNGNAEAGLTLLLAAQAL